MGLGRKLRVVAAVVALAGLIGPAAASDRRGRHGLDQDQVLDAVKRGEIKPLAEVLAAVEKTVPGRVVKVEIERRRGRLVYEIKVIADQGRVREVYIDAATLEILKGE